MTHWFASGQVAFCIAGLMVFEIVALAVLHRLRSYFLTILAGEFLLLAWAVSAHWTLAAPCLLASLAAHVKDMKERGAL